MRDPVRARIAAYVDLGRHADAEALLGPALAEEPDDVDLLGLLTRNLLGQERLAEALAAADRVVRLSPDGEWGHRLRSLALSGLDRDEEATAAAQEAVRLAPERWQTHLQLASAAVGCRNRLLQAQDAADRAVALAPDQPDAHFICGLVAQHRRWDDQAAGAYRRALALDPQHSGALHNLTLLESRGIRRRARGFAEVLSIDPQDDTAMANVDWLAARFVRRLYWAALVGFLLALPIALTRKDAGLSTPAPLGIGLAALLAFGTLAATWWMARSVPTGIRRYVAPRLLREPFLAALTTLTGVLLLCAITACLLPAVGASIAGAAALRLIGLANIVIVVWSRARARE